jgi:hypothetical protein
MLVYKISRLDKFIFRYINYARHLGQFSIEQT